MQKGFVAKSEAVINTTPDKVWEALTNPELIKQYLFGTEAISDWKVGSSITYKGVWEGKSYSDKGTIIELVPEKLLVTTYWSSMGGREDRPENYNTVSYILEQVNDGTKLTIKQDNNTTEKSRDHSQSNWDTVLQSLKKLLE